MKKILQILILMIIFSFFYTAPAAADDFTVSISVSASPSKVYQGQNFNVKVSASGRYTGDEPYNMTKQVLVKETVYLEGKIIGSGTVPIGPGIFNPGQSMSLNDTITCKVPTNISPGKHTVEVRFYASAFGSTMEKTRSTSIEVLAEEEEEEELFPPVINLSLFPEEMFYGSTSTITIRVFNPNDYDMTTSVLLQKKKKVGTYFIEDILFELEPNETKEIRRSFNLQQKVTELCFIGEIRSYTLDRKLISAKPYIQSEACANILQRPVFMPSVDFDNFEQSNDQFSADMHVNISNSNSWDDTIVPKKVSVRISNPDGLTLSMYELEYYNLNKNIYATIHISGGLEGQGANPGSLEITAAYPEIYDIEDETIRYNYSYPDSDKIKQELGIEEDEDGDPGNGTENGSNEGNNTTNQNLLQFFDYLRGSSSLDLARAQELFNQLILWQKEVFS